MSNIHWAAAVSGAFTTDADWTGGSTPTATDDAILDATGAPYTVTSSAKSQTVNGLQTVSGATLAVAKGTIFTATNGTDGGASAGTITVGDGGVFAAGGTLENDGLIKLNGSTKGATLLAVANLTLTGLGVVKLSDSANNAITGAFVFENVSNTVQGSGVIGGAGMTFVNDAMGTINGNGLKGLTISTPDFVSRNAGLIEATNSGGVTISKTVLDQFTGGDTGSLFAADHDRVFLASTTIIGGNLNSVGAGAIEAIDQGVFLDGTELDGVYNQGTFDVAQGAATHAEGELRNAGNINLLSGALPPATNYSDLIVGAPNAGIAPGPKLPLDGIVGATLKLDNGGVVNVSAQGRIFGETTADTLENVDNTIVGGGFFGLGRLNIINDAKGVINANGGDMDLRSTPGSSIINDGLIEETGSGILVVYKSTIDSTGAKGPGAAVQAAGSARIDLFDANLVGGSVSVASISAIWSTGDALSTIDVGAGTLDNAGSLYANGNGTNTGAGLSILGAVANTGVLFAYKGELEVNGAVTGGGIGKINGGTLKFDQTFTENVIFASQNPGELVLAQSQGYTGTVTGFSTIGMSTFDLEDINFSESTTATYVPTNGKQPFLGGVLTVTDGAHSATIKLVGNYSHSTFTVTADGSGGTLVSDTVAAKAQTVSIHTLTTAMASLGGHSDLSQGLMTPRPFVSHPPLLAASRSFAA